MPSRQVTLVEKAGPWWAHRIPLSDRQAPGHAVWAVVAHRELLGATVGMYSAAGDTYDPEIIVTRADTVVDGILWVYKESDG